MFKILVFLFLSFCLSFGNDFEISADDLQRNGDVLTAKGNAMVLSPDAHLFADLIEVNNVTKDVYLKGNVKIYKDSSIFVNTNEITLNLNSNKFLLSQFYAQESTYGMWIISKDVYSHGKKDNASKKDEKDEKDEEYHFSNATISGCRIDNPIWRINATSGTYNKDYEFMSVWNPTLYLANIPVFYFPYLFFPTGTTRKSGLLQTDIEVSSKEGVFIAQPFFLAPYDMWDMTFTPQIRTQRGFGVNYEFKIADWQNNIATFKYKFFNNYDKYITQYNLKNRRIHGVELEYQTDNILKNIFGLNIQDGFFTDITYMNDIDYNQLDNLQTPVYNGLYYSRANYFIYSQDHYLGTYFKYALDVYSPTNNASFHTLPNIHYHKFMDYILTENILYNLDFQSKNITRGSGYGYVQNSAHIPFGVNLSVLKILQLSAFVNLKANHININNTQDTISPLTNSRVSNNMDYASMDYSIRANLDLAKRYNSFFHSVHFEGLLDAPLTRYYTDDFSKASYDAYANVATTININNSTKYFNPNDIFDLSGIATTLKLKASQYFYNKRGTELFYHRIYQNLYLDRNIYTLTQDLQNELGVSPFSFLNLNTSVYYSHLLTRFNEISLAGNITTTRFNLNATYYFKLNRNVLDSGKYDLLNNHTKFLRVNSRYDFGLFRVGAGIGYDVANVYTKDWYAFINKDMHCWGLGLRFASELRPIRTNQIDNPIQVITNNYIRFELRFVPLSGVNLGYKIQQDPRNP